MGVSDLLARAGLGRVPTPVLAGVLAVATSLAVLSWVGPSRAAVTIEPSPEVPGAEEGPAPSAEETAMPEPAAVLAVHLVGAVMRPGVYEVPEGSRISDAVGLAGGLTGDAAEESVNLARRVVDGEQVRVATQNEQDAGEAAPVPAGPGSVTPAPSASGPVNINTADAAMLETLPGIGPSTAAKIIADREANGPFSSVEELLRVSGIGERKLEGLSGLVTVR